MKFSAMRHGFTLVELLVSTALLSLVAVLLVSMTNSTASTWRYTTGKIEQFRSASNAFDAMTRRISQATLNTYWDYQYPGNNPLVPPTSYGRQSELRFVSGQAQALTSNTSCPTQAMFFQAPLGFVDDATDFGGMENLLNTWGYYVQFGPETQPGFLSSVPNPPALHYRFQLMEMMEPSNKMSLYSYTSGTGRYQAKTPNNWLYLTGTGAPGGYTGYEWFTNALSATSPSEVHVLAENVIALIVLPKLSTADEQNLMASGSIPNNVPAGTSLAPNYSYDSTQTGTNAYLNPKNQLPPTVQVTMVAVDEASYNRLQAGTAEPNLGLSTLFLSAANYQADLDQLQANLLQHAFTDATSGISYAPSVKLAVSLNYRIFTSNISIRGAKWSRN